MAKNLYEIFDEFEQRTKKEDKLAVLRFNRNYAMDCVLRGAFHPNIEYTIESIPTYREDLDSPPGMSYSSISLEMDRVYLFEKNNPRVPPELTQKRKEQILVQILESLEAKESKIFAGMIMKKLPVKGLTYKIVKEAFPELLP